MNTSFVRPMILRNREAEVAEEFFYARFVVYCATRMAPRSKKRLGKDGKPITDAKPASALAPLYGYRRVLRDGGVQLPSLQMLVGHVRGLTTHFKARWGVKGLLPDRGLPFDQPMLLAIHRVLDKCLVSDTWSVQRHKALLPAFLFGLSTGIRLEEAVDPEDHYKRSQFVLVRASRALPMTATSLASACDGDFIRARSGPAKNDPDGTVWGDRDMWFRLRSGDPLNFGWAWVRWELEYLCPPEQRATWAAFSPDGDKRPYTERALRTAFDTTVVCAIGKEEAARRKWHALRVTAATALGTAKQADGVIQALVRWKSLEAMRLYAKMNCHTYADAVDLITSTSIDVTRADSLPAIDVPDAVHSLEDAVATLHLDEEDAAAYLLDGKPLPSKASGKASTSRTTAPGRQLAAAATADDEPAVKPLTRPTRIVEVGEDSAEVFTDAEQGLAGARALVHNSLWPTPAAEAGGRLPWNPNGFSEAVVVGECVQKTRFEKRKRAVAAFVITCDDEAYFIRAPDLRDAVARASRSPPNPPPRRGRSAARR